MNSGNRVSPRRLFLLGLLVAALALPGLAAAAGGGNAAKMALTSADLGGAKAVRVDLFPPPPLFPGSDSHPVVVHRFIDGLFEISSADEKVFNNARIGTGRVSSLVAIVAVAASGGDAQAFARALDRELDSPAALRGRVLGGAVKQFIFEPGSVRLLHARHLRAGDDAIEIELSGTPLTLCDGACPGLSLTVAGAIFVQVGPVISAVYWNSESGLRGPSAGQAGDLARLMAKRISAALPTPPVDVTPPVLTDAPVVGVTSTVSPGTWTGASSFTFRWERCNAGGGDCVAIPGATASSYSVSTDDIDTSLVVVVTATNKSGSTTVVTAPSGLVGG
jgi:hypothetical protein